MSEFPRNIELALLSMNETSVKAVAGRIGINRTTLSRLKSGSRKPSPKHLALIARFIGLAYPDDLLRPTSEFEEILKGIRPPLGSPIHSFAVLVRNLPRCVEQAAHYQGQYILYAPSSRDGMVIASLLELGEVTPHGLRVSLVNPYNGHDGEYLAFKYNGFAIPVSDYVYVFVEQEEMNYEVANIIFHAAPIPPAQVLEGVWSGIGVKRNRRFVSASTCVAVRTKRAITDWKQALNDQLGYRPIGALPAVAQLKIKEGGIIIS